AARGSLASTGGLAATIQAGHVARRTFDAARASGSIRDSAETVHIDVAAAGGLERLRELGRQGARLVALQGTRCQIQL
ncbi:MAG: prephenate dehydrogenase, partial [Actinomycetota bacterium]|nr:prephenate dehydrogenase [Actinomycetota bacterium]